MITVPVRQITRATPRIRILNLDVRAVAFRFTAGQAVMLGLSGSPLRKPYSIASAPWEVEKSGIMQVLVQVEDSGGLDPHLELASPGTPLDLDGPFGSFGLPEHVERPLLFIAGGTGIAPLRSMLIQHLARPTKHPVTLIYSARTVDEFAFRPELGAVESAGRIACYFTVTREESAEWPGRRGRISEALLKEALPALDSVCLICGPPQLVNDARAQLARLGVDDSQILIEKY
jgi:ferredoxin-NADP reductase